MSARNHYENDTLAVRARHYTGLGFGVAAGVTAFFMGPWGAACIARSTCFWSLALIPLFVDRILARIDAVHSGNVPFSLGAYVNYSFGVMAVFGCVFLTRDTLAGQ